MVTRRGGRGDASSSSPGARRRAPGLSPTPSTATPSASPSPPKTSGVAVSHRERARRHLRGPRLRARPPTTTSPATTSRSSLSPTRPADATSRPRPTWPTSRRSHSRVVATRPEHLRHLLNPPRPHAPVTLAAAGVSSRFEHRRRLPSPPPPGGRRAVSLSWARATTSDAPQRAGRPLTWRMRPCRWNRPAALLLRRRRASPTASPSPPSPPGERLLDGAERHRRAVETGGFTSTTCASRPARTRSAGHPASGSSSGLRPSTSLHLPRRGSTSPHRARRNEQAPLAVALLAVA